MATKIHFKERPDPSGNSRLQLLYWFSRHFFTDFCLPAIKVICKEPQTDHTYLKLKYGPSLCNWQLDCVQYTKLDSPAGKVTHPPLLQWRQYCLIFLLNFRTIDPTKIIVTGKRVRFSFIGISDIIYFDPNQTNQAAAIANYQQVHLVFWLWTSRLS